MKRQPRTEVGKRLLSEGFRHDLNCQSALLGLEACNCNLPGLLRNVEDEARAPFFETLAWIEDKVKPSDISMSGKSSGFPGSAPRSQQIWERIQGLFNEEADMSQCVCGSSDLLRHQGFCHFGWHMEGCEHDGR
jgi:hypothetical protein